MNRILILFMGVCIAYAAIYFGDGVRSWWPSHELLSSGSVLVPAQQAQGIVVIMFGAVSVVLGGYCWCVAMDDVFYGDRIDGRSTKKAFQATGGLIFLCILFGIVAAPITSYGPFPWEWASMWDVIPIFALMPTVLIMHAVLTAPSRQDQEDRNAQIIDLPSFRQKQRR